VRLVAAALFGIDVKVWGGIAAMLAAGAYFARSLGWIAKVLRRPKLKLTCSSGGCRPVAATMHWNDQHPRARLSIIRLDVANIGGAPAERVRLKVARVRVLRDGSFEEQPEHQRLRRLPLGWSNYELQNPDATGEPRDISPRDSEEVDLLHVNEVVPNELHLDTRPGIPPDNPQHLKDQAVALDLALASTAGTRQYKVTVSLAEPWTDPTAPASLVVDGPRPVRRRARERV
jgi:hypothetical protein